MNVTFEEKDALNALLTIELTKDDYQPSVDSELKKYRNKAKIPGFRPGMAPMGMIKKMVGNAILVEEVNKLATNTLFNYLQENNIDVLGQPLASDEQAPIDFETQENFKLYFDLGLAPKFDLNFTPKDKLVRYNILVSDEELATEVDNNQRRYGKMLEIDMTETDQDTVKGLLTELDSNGEALEGGVEGKETTVLLELVKDADTQKSLLGKKVGDMVELDIFKFFNDNEKVLARTLELPVEGLNDINKTFKFEITEVKRFEKAEINQELFDLVFGEGAVSSEEEFKTKLKENIASYYNSEAEHQLEHSISHLIHDNHSLTLPDAFLKRWLVKTYPDTYTDENIDEKYQHEAGHLRSQLITEKLVSEFKLEVSNEEIADVSYGYTVQLLRQYGLTNPDMETIKYFEQKNKEDRDFMRRVGDMAINRKVMQQIKSMVTIETKDIQVDDFYKMIEHHNHEHNHH